LKEGKVLNKRYNFIELKPHSEKHVSTGAEHIKSAVYGGLDGIITTYSVVMGVLGVKLI
jgi:DNA damage-binding protein 1